MFPYQDRFLPSFFLRLLFHVVLQTAVPTISCPKSQFHLPTFLISFPWGLLTKSFFMARLVFLSTHRKLSLSKANTLSKFLFKYYRRICSSFPFISNDSDWKMSCKNVVQRLHEVILGLKHFRPKCWRQNVQKWGFIVREKASSLIRGAAAQSDFLACLKPFNIYRTL